VTSTISSPLNFNIRPVSLHMNERVSGIASCLMVVNGNVSKT